MDGVVLGYGDQSLPLVAVDPCHAHAADQIRRLSEGFLGSSPTNIPGQVDDRSPGGKKMSGLALDGGLFGDLADQIGIERRAHGDRHGKDRRAGRVGLAMQGLVFQQGGNLEPGNARRTPIVGDLADLLVDRHTREQIVDALFNRQLGIEIFRTSLLRLLRGLLRQPEAASETAKKKGQAEIPGRSAYFQDHFQSPAIERAVSICSASRDGELAASHLKARNPPGLGNPSLQQMEHSCTHRNSGVVLCKPRRYGVFSKKNAQKKAAPTP